TPPKTRAPPAPVRPLPPPPTPDAAPPEPRPARSARTAPPGNADAEALPHSGPELTDAETNTETGEVLPTINEVSLSGAQALPELHLDVHVYATQPADRFVYINMRKYHEGAKLQEGPTIERI